MSRSNRSSVVVALSIAACLSGSTAAAQSIATPAEQIALAVQAAPRAFRDGAAVLGYNAAGESVQLRPGTNGIICLAHDPKQENFHVSCYHRSLEPFMAPRPAAAGPGVWRQRYRRDGCSDHCI